MFKHILIATDGSDLADKAVAQGLALAVALSAKVTAVTVTMPWSLSPEGEWPIFFPIEDYDRAASESAQRILQTVSEKAKAAGVACDVVYVKGQYPADAILGEAKSQTCDLIVMASHGRRGLARLVLGSEAIRVLTQSTVPVLICR